MNTPFGVIVLLLSLLGWVGQIISAISPPLAVRWGLMESKTVVDPVFHADVRAECVWDSLTLWTLPLAAVLLLVGEPSWTFFGLIGGGMYLYFGGRGVAQRITMRRSGIKVGEPGTVKTAYVFLTLWGVAGLATIVLAARALWG